MQINRSISKSKEVVYTVEDRGVQQFQAVIDEQRDLLVVYPGDGLTRAHVRALDKLVAKAKARDGIRYHVLLVNSTLTEVGGELVITTGATAA